MKKTGGWLYCRSAYTPPPGVKNCTFKGKAVSGSKAKKYTAPGIIQTVENPNAELAAILDEVRDGKNNIFVNALAGTGKTFTAVQCVKIWSQKNLSVCMLAFSKRDKEAMAEKVGSLATVYTSNGAGFSILANSLGGRIKLNDKLPKILLDDSLEATGERNAKGEFKTLCRESVKVIEKVVDLLRTAKLFTAPQVPTNDDVIEILNQFSIDYKEDKKIPICEWTIRLFIRLASIDTAKTHGIDFTNQIFLPVYHGMSARTTFDRVVIDEAQDQNPYNREIAFALLAKNGRMFVVGDNKQAIYEWRGASSTAMADIADRMKTPPVYFTLTECRRCPVKVLDLVRGLVPNIKALPEAIQGEIEYLRDDVDLFEVLTKKKSGLVMCRVNAPLVSLCLKFLGTGIRAVLAKSNVLQQLGGFVDTLSEGKDSASVSTIVERAGAWLFTQSEKVANYRNAADLIQGFTDKHDCILALCMPEDIHTAGDIKHTLSKMFPRDEIVNPDNCIVLSTVHGQKGGEADDVYILSPIKTKNGKECPSVFNEIWCSPEDRDNLLYVAATRAKKTLTFAGPVPSFFPFAGSDASDEDGHE
jgi:superfamily I DNA/RNA helicase